MTGVIAHAVAGARDISAPAPTAISVAAARSARQSRLTNPCCDSGGAGLLPSFAHLPIDPSAYGRSTFAPPTTPSSTIRAFPDPD